MSAAFIPEVLYIIKLFKNQSSTVNLPKITLRVNAVIFITALLLLGVALIYDINYFKYKAPIEYSEWQEIDWSDFRAIKRPKQTLHGNQNFAFICTEIACKFSDEELEVKTFFHPARSYTFSEEVAGKNLLKHELFHLHITEYWARELRKSIHRLKDKSDKSKLNEVIGEFKQKEREMQYKYDDDTYHGYILGTQRDWEHRIDSSLLSLENYSKPNIKF